MSAQFHELLQQADTRAQKPPEQAKKKWPELENLYAASLIPLALKMGAQHTPLIEAIPQLLDAQLQDKDSIPTSMAYNLGLREEEEYSSLKFLVVSPRGANFRRVAVIQSHPSPDNISCIGIFDMAPVEWAGKHKIFKVWFPENAQENRRGKLAEKSMGLEEFMSYMRTPLPREEEKGDYRKIETEGEKETFPQWTNRLQTATKAYMIGAELLKQTPQENRVDLRKRTLHAFAQVIPDTLTGYADILSQTDPVILAKSVAAKEELHDQVTILQTLHALESVEEAVHLESQGPKTDWEELAIALAMKPEPARWKKGLLLTNIEAISLLGQRIETYARKPIEPVVHNPKVIQALGVNEQYIADIREFEEQYRNTLQAGALFFKGIQPLVFKGTPAVIGPMENDSVTINQREPYSIGGWVENSMGAAEPRFLFPLGIYANELLALQKQSATLALMPPAVLKNQSVMTHHNKIYDVAEQAQNVMFRLTAGDKPDSYSFGQETNKRDLQYWRTPEMIAYGWLLGKFGYQYPSFRYQIDMIDDKGDRGLAEKIVTGLTSVTPEVLEQMKAVYEHALYMMPQAHEVFRELLNQRYIHDDNELLRVTKVTDQNAFLNAFMQIATKSNTDPEDHLPVRPLDFPDHNYPILRISASDLLQGSPENATQPPSKDQEVVLELLNSFPNTSINYGEYPPEFDKLAQSLYERWGLDGAYYKSIVVITEGDDFLKQPFAKQIVHSLHRAQLKILILQEEK